MFGSDKLVLTAAKFNALSMMRSRIIEKRALGPKIIVLEDPSLEEEPAWTEIPSLLQTFEDEIAGLMARRALEESLEEKINNKLPQKHWEYIKEIIKKLVKEEDSPDNSQALKKYALLEKKHSQQHSRTASKQLRPSSLGEVFGQEAGMRFLKSKLSSPFLPHIFLYGSPGIGKTTAARLALDGAASASMKQRGRWPGIPILIRPRSCAS